MIEASGDDYMPFRLLISFRQLISTIISPTVSYACEMKPSVDKQLLVVALLLPATFC